MKEYSLPIFHAAMAAAGAARMDVEDGCVDTWNCYRSTGPIKGTENVDMATRGTPNFYLAIAKYSDKLASYYNNLIEMYNGEDPDERHDGPFSMSVSMTFGEWFANYVQLHAAPPSEAEAENAIQELIDEYLSSPATTIVINPDNPPPQ